MKCRKKQAYINKIDSKSALLKLHADTKMTCKNIKRDFEGKKNKHLEEKNIIIKDKKYLFKK